MTLRLDRELAIPVQELLTGGSSLNRANVLEQTFNSVELVGRPLSIGNFVTQNSLGTPISTSITNTYTPYLVIGDDASTIADSEIITGNAFQESITNFPFGTQLLTGLFLELELSGPDGPLESFERTLFDRIGFDIRRNGGSPDFSIDVDSPPALSDADVFTIYAASGDGNLNASTTYIDEIVRDIEELQASLSVDPTPEESFKLRTSQQELTRLVGDVLLRLSEIHTDQSSEASLVEAYFDRLRLVIVSSRVDLTAQDSETLQFSIDLVRNDIRALPYPGQNESAEIAFKVVRGLFENANEEDLFGSTVISPDETPELVGAIRIFETAVSQEISLVSVTSLSRSRLDALAISAEAKGQISDSLTS